MAADHLADDHLAGVDAAVAVITNTAVVVNELLDTERRLVRAATDPAQVTRPGRGFTALDLTNPAPLPAAFQNPGPRPDRPPQR